VGLGVGYGNYIGNIAVIKRTTASWAQLLLTAVNVPALLMCTLVITFPSLYVFSAMLGTRLSFLDVLRVLVAAVAVNLCVLAAFGPITGFFTISTTSYSFMKLLNVAFFAIAGVLGIGFLIRVLSVLEAKGSAAAPPAGAPVVPSAAVPPLIGEQRTRKVLGVWIVLYAVVGAQMGWVLRPFIGDPEQPFVLFRGREANIFADILRSLGQLFE
jgi:hypothetical protein